MEREHEMHAVQLVVDSKAETGELPSWDARRKVLYWADTTRFKLHVYNPSTKTDIAFDTGQYIGAIAPRRSGGIVIALQHGFYTYDFETHKMTLIAAVEQDKPNNRINDGKCDPAGRLWAGTKSFDGTPNAGALYCLDTDWSVRKVLDRVTVSNGIAWSPDYSTMYYIDTPTMKVMAFDYNLAAGTIRNPRVAAVFASGGGVPDSMTSDEEGMIWIAVWGGHAVTRWNPRTGKLLETVNVPATRTSNCVFGGDGLNDLYITTARKGLEESVLSKEPYAGGLFVLRTNVKGMPTFAFGG